MAKKMKAKAVATEELSTAELEQKVQENAGVQIEDGVYKVDLTKPPTSEKEPEPEPVKEEPAEEEIKEEPVLEESTEEPVVETEEKEEPILEEIGNEENTVDNTGVEGSPEVADDTPEQEEVLPEEKTQIEYPENIQELVKFMNDTGGSLEDYVKLNKDYAGYEDMSLLREFYEKSKPHLTPDEISFLIEDKFSFDEEIDEPKDIKRKKLAFKEEVADAKKQLENQKANYYKEIKAGSKLTQDQQKAVDFFSRYKEESVEKEKTTQSQRSVFDNKTKSLFNNQFKGFEYKVGDKRYRFNVKNVNEVKETQSDINNFVKKFLNEKNEMNDAPGYHKSLFTAMNADAIANHFYEQGKTDAIKESVKTAKNINMDPRSGHKNIEASGIKARVVGGLDSKNLKLKLKNY
tara:strand:- start:269 stop:1483 length:1215 start_codon:yes stop_codon:yes gene_type:complete